MTDQTKNPDFFRSLNTALATTGSSGSLLNALITTSSPLDRDSISNAFAEVEKNDIRVARMFVSDREYADIMKFSGVGRYHLETDKKKNAAGVMAWMWGAMVIVSKHVPDGTVYICGDDKDLDVGRPLRYYVNPLAVSSITVK